MEDKELFRQVFARMQQSYPDQELHLYADGMVSLKGELIFNTNGFNLLYNLQRLCDAIKEELI